MPNYYLVNHDTGEVVNVPIEADEPPSIESQDWEYLTEIQTAAFLAREEEGEGAYVEGVEMKDGTYCMGCVPKDAKAEDVVRWLYDDLDLTPGAHVCDICCTVFLENQTINADGSVTVNEPFPEE